MKKLVTFISLFFISVGSFLPFEVYAQSESTRCREDIPNWTCEIVNPLPGGCEVVNVWIGTPNRMRCEVDPGGRRGISGYTCSEGGEGVGGFYSHTCTPGVAPELPPRQQAENLGYVPLEPIPGLTDSGGTGDFASLIGAAFRILLVIGALFAVAMLVVGGVMYMMSEALPTKDIAKKRIQAAVWGLLLLIGAWLILNTINPQLLQVGPGRPPSGGVAAGGGFTTGGGFGGGGFTTGGGFGGDFSFSTWSFASQAAAEILTSDYFESKGYAGLLTINEVTVLSTDIEDNAAEDLRAYLIQFSQQCMEQGGWFDTYVFPGSAHQAYFCASREEPTDSAPGEEEVEIFRGAMNASQRNAVKQIIPDCAEAICSIIPGYRAMDSSVLDSTAAQEDLHEFAEMCSGFYPFIRGGGKVYQLEDATVLGQPEGYYAYICYI